VPTAVLATIAESLDIKAVTARKHARKEVVEVIERATTADSRGTKAVIVASPGRKVEAVEEAEGVADVEEDVDVEVAEEAVVATR
jgi:biotin synthase-like enzyme